jgi:hypothetical protein
MLIVYCDFHEGDLKSLLYWKSNTRLLANFHKVSTVLDTCVIAVYLDLVRRNWRST